MKPKLLNLKQDNELEEYLSNAEQEGFESHEQEEQEQEVLYDDHEEEE